MFKTARMRKIRIVTLDKYVAPTVDALHESGLLQVSDISDSVQQDPELAELVKLLHTLVNYLHFS